MISHDTMVPKRAKMICNVERQRTKTEDIFFASRSSSLVAGCSLQTNKTLSGGASSVSASTLREGHRSRLRRCRSLKHRTTTKLKQQFRTGVVDVADHCQHIGARTRLLGRLFLFQLLGRLQQKRFSFIESKQRRKSTDETNLAASVKHVDSVFESVVDRRARRTATQTKRTNEPE